ncbi:MAG: Rrf2 family transcriptional regulator [Candidatus Bipolaricaulota bacterium]
MFTRSTQYVVLALAELAAQPPGTRMHTRELASAAAVPPSFLAKLIPLLSRAGLVRATRGRTGGVELARAPGEIAVADIIRAVDGERFFQECLFNLEPCAGDVSCPMYPVWDPIRSKITALFETTTLEEIAHCGLSKGNQGTQGTAAKEER